MVKDPALSSLQQWNIYGTPVVLTQFRKRLEKRQLTRLVSVIDYSTSDFSRAESADQPPHDEGVEILGLVHVSQNT